MRPNIRDNQHGSAAVDKFQGRVRRTHLANLRRKDQVHFGTLDGVKGPIESVFRQMIFKPLVYFSFGEMSSNVRELIETAVEYEVQHLGKNMVATTVDTVRSALRRRYRTQFP